MDAADLEIQGSWDAKVLRDQWPMTPDNVYVFRRLLQVPSEVTAAGATGRVLEVAAADASHACRLNLRGLQAFALEPSPAMLGRARAKMEELGATVTLVRAIAETMPFPDASFDRVLCDSALDHLADPERGVREMARVTRPGGRVVLTFVNYGGVTSRASRAIYRVGRALGVLAPETKDTKQFWDSPVPYEHTFECTLENVREMCAPYLELDHAFGVSLGWMLPGWGRLLESRRGLQRLLGRLDRIAQRRPALADMVVTVWRPRPHADWPCTELRTRPTNPVYRRLLADEIAYWERADFGRYFGDAIAVTARARNQALTGDPERTWLDDLAARGPFRTAAMLGCDDAPWEADWLARGGSERLDVYDLSPGVIAQVRARAGDLQSRLRFIGADLNFVELPRAAYDVVWTSGLLHCITNLEHLLSQVAGALRPGGLFALQGYVGERRMQYDAARLAAVNEILQSVPAKFRRVDEVARPDPAWTLSPFGAVRSDEILAILAARPDFEPVHVGVWGRLFPLDLCLDTAAMARDEPALLERIARREAALAAQPAIRPALAYAVYRRRG